MIILKLLFTLFLSFIFIKLIIKNAVKLGLTDVPNERSSHVEIKPRGAGIGFGLAFFLSVILFNSSLFIEYWLVFLSILLVFFIGILDDHKDASPKMKFYVMFISSILLYLNNIYFDNLGSYFGYIIPLGFLSLPCTMFFIAGITNSLNLIDGLDGLSGSISLVILSTFLYIGYINENELMCIISLFTIISLLPFLFLNWNPAKIFMGDSGSLFLGFIIATLSILSLEYIHPVAVVYIIAIPILDTLIVMVRRIIRGKSPFSPDKTHIHHILLKFFGKKVKKTVLFIVLIQILFSLVGLLLALSSKELDVGLTSFVAILGFFGILKMFYMIFTGMKRRQKLIEKLVKRKKRV